MLDLFAQFAEVEKDVRQAIERVLSTQVFINGPEVEQAEWDILEFCGMDGAAIGMSSGTDALLATLMALGVGPGDEVVTTPYSFFATAGVIHRLGAKPVFVDVLPDTFNINPELIAGAITQKTKALIPVHLYGRCVDMDAVLEAARDVPVVEDAAQALGAKYAGRSAGSMGAAGCFSFFPSKNLGVLGDGGMVVTRRPELGEKIRFLRNHGETSRYHHRFVGGNFRLDALAAAVIRAKLPFLSGWSEARRRNAERYARLFSESGLLGDFILALPDAGADGHVFNQYVPRVKDRDGLVAHLRDEAHVGCAIYYPVPLHLQECFAALGYKKGDFPEAERAASESVALPVYPELSEVQQRAVVAAIGRYYGI